MGDQERWADPQQYSAFAFRGQRRADKSSNLNQGIDFSRIIVILIISVIGNRDNQMENQTKTLTNSPTTKRAEFVAKRAAELVATGFTTRAAQRRAVKDWVLTTPAHKAALARRFESAHYALEAFIVLDGPTAEVISANL